MSATSVITTPDRPRLVHTVTEAAALLGISRAHAYGLVRTGELPHLRLGRRIVVPATALAKLLDATIDAADDP